MGDKKDKKQKKDKKDKKESKKVAEEEPLVGDDEATEIKGDYKTRLFVSPIADPIAEDKLSKKLLKQVRRSMKEKQVRRGVKETVKSLRKDGDGIVLIAADISPIDVLSHLPILCEEKGVPYIYVKSRAEVGEACKTKRPTSCVLITAPSKKSEDYEDFKDLRKAVTAANSYL